MAEIINLNKKRKAKIRLEKEKGLPKIGSNLDVQKRKTVGKKGK